MYMLYNFILSHGKREGDHELNWSTTLSSPNMNEIYNTKLHFRKKEIIMYCPLSYPCNNDIMCKGG